MPRKSGFIIIPVHNRKPTTLRCLRNLRRIGAFKHSILVVDDGSSDGTSESVGNTFPEVQILEGDGHRWWTGGIELGMRYAYEHGAKYFIWLNDDANPERGAIESLIDITSRTKGITGGTGISDIDGRIIHSGRIKGTFGLRPATAQARNGLLSVDTVSGNLVCIHRQVVDKIGFPDAKSLPMGPGDFDYSLTARKHNIPVLVDPKAIVVCAENVAGSNSSLILSDTPLNLYWKQILQLNSGMHWKTKFIFSTRHWGLLGLVKYFYDYFKLLILSVIRLVLPLKIRKSLYPIFSVSKR